jgi:hypothetical protein
MKKKEVRTRIKPLRNKGAKMNSSNPYEGESRLFRHQHSQLSHENKIHRETIIMQVPTNSRQARNPSNLRGSVILSGRLVSTK